MSSTLSAMDLWPLVQKLPSEERIRLARLVLGESTRMGHPDTALDTALYHLTPPTDGEFVCESDLLAWEGEGWEEFYASR